MRHPNKKFFCSEKKVYKQLDPEKEYSLYQLSKHDLLRTGAVTFNACRNSVRRIVQTDKLFKDILKARIEKDKDGKLRYYILGSNIARYLMRKD